ncbi:hypothetical protein J0H33_06035 [bacterium]|nr:hypothetical protein [bacterium]
MDDPIFRTIRTEAGEGVTYDCGCPCTPTAIPAADGYAGSEHCCCGKVHFAGIGAAERLDAYLAERKVTKRREPEYARGTSSLGFDGRTIEVAWAFPLDA